MWWKYLVGLAMAGVIVAVFVLPPPQAAIGDASRIFFFHVPAAICGFIAFIVAAIYGGVYLRTRSLAADDKAAVSAEIGLVYSVIAMLSGSIFAKVTWGAFWNWDPRQTTLLAVLLIYAAYFALRQAVSARSTRARLSAVYLLLAGFVAPLLFFVLPRMQTSLHPKDTLVGQGGMAMTTAVALTFAVAVITYVLLYIWLFKLAVRARRIKDKLETEGETVI